MKQFLTILTVLGALSPLSAGASDDALLARMAALNPNLHSYTATMKAHVALETFPFLAADIVATIYHKDPDKNKVEITSGLPMIASQFGKLYPHIEPPSKWRDTFIITKIGDDGTRATYRLVPRVNGNVGHIDATVNEADATIATMRWSYANGGSAEMDNRYANIGGDLVIVAQTGEVQEPNYRGTVTATLEDYKINPPLDDSIFTQ